MAAAEKVDLAIVGTGWYGLITAKTYLDLHPAANVVLVDSAASIGGVWAKERLYPGLKTNSILGRFEYPDFPMDPDTYGVTPGSFIPGDVVHRYLNDFAHTADLTRRVRLGTKVEAAERQDGGGWLLSLAPAPALGGTGGSTGGSKSALRAAKLVLATGNTSEPFVPAIPGADAFGAPIFHVKELRARLDTIKSAKNAVVLGGTKSAWDAAFAFAVEGGAQVHLVMRETGHGPMWMAPPAVSPLKKPLETLVNTRFLTWFSPCVWGFHDGYIGIRNFLHGTAFGRKVVDTFWGILAGDILDLNKYAAHPETAKLKPWSNPMFMGSGLGILNYSQDFFQLVRDGKIKVHVGDISALSKGTVTLSTGAALPADALVLSTGWKHHPPLALGPGGDARYGLPHASDAYEAGVADVDAEILTKFPRLQKQPVQNAKYQDPRARAGDAAPTALNVPYMLYRFMVPPASLQDRDLAFAGVPMQVLTAPVAAVQALWLAAYLDGNLPVRGDAEQEARLHARFGKWRYPAGHGAQIPDFVFDAVPYLDMLVTQLGLRAHRKRGFFAELFEPYGAGDYRGLLSEWRAAHGGVAS